MGWGGATIFTHPSYCCLLERFYNLPRWHHPPANSLQNMSLQSALQIQARVEIPKVLCVKDSKNISSKFMRKKSRKLRHLGNNEEHIQDGS